MAKPDFPEWDSTEVNIVEADIAHKEEGWLKPGGIGEKPPLEYFNWWQNLVYKWILWISSILGGNRIVIDSQAKFDAYFDGVGTKTGNIYLAEVGVDYQLNNEVDIGTNFKLDGDKGVLVEKANNSARFVTSNAVSNVNFTDNISFNGNKALYSATNNGGFVRLVGSGTSNCRFETNVYDCKSDSSGGAYSATLGTTTNLIIKNISNCEAGGNGGGVFNVEYSEISNVSGCSALTEGSGTSGGGGVSNCNYCKLKNIHDNSTAGAGGGCFNCDNCIIEEVYGNTYTGGLTVNSGAGLAYCDDCDIKNIHDNIAPYNGGGLAFCSRCTIANVHDNEATAASGGGLYDCTYCTVTNVYNNTSGASGGGARSCAYSSFTGVDSNSAVNGGGLADCSGCTLTNVTNNSASNSGGGAHSCDSCGYFGWWDGNTAATNDTINDGTFSLALAHKTFASYITETTGGTLNVN